MKVDFDRLRSLFDFLGSGDRDFGRRNHAVEKSDREEIVLTAA